MVAALGAAAAISVAAMGPAQAATEMPPTPLKTVSFLGHTFAVPESWPVVDLTANPTACVRFDIHAVYLGTPGTHQVCPSHLVGRTEALLVEPDNSGTPSGVTSSAVERRLHAKAAGIKATGAYDADPGLIRKILVDAGFASTAPKQASSAASGAAATSVTPAVWATTATARPAAVQAAATAVNLPSDATSYTGKGFDACQAPDGSTMSTWLTNSPYKAVGVYIGGADMGCPTQPNLNPSWMQQQYTAGWRFMPLYVGLQASQITSPIGDGTAAADDAVSKASALGLGAGSVLYYDMEAYDTTKYTSTVMSFLSAWNQEIHAKGYNSAVYSSASSAIQGLANNGDCAHSYTMPDAVFTARWNGAADTNEPVIPSGSWANHQRVHQYDGDVTETWGGATINIDHDYLDIQVSSWPAPPAPSSTPAAPAPTARSSVYNPDLGKAEMFAVGSDGAMWHACSVNSGAWSPWVSMGGNFSSKPVTIYNPDTRTEEAFALGTDGLLYHAYSINGTQWSGWSSLGGWTFAGSPAAVYNPSTKSIELFCLGRDGRMNHAYYTSGGTWSPWSTLDTGYVFSGSPSTVFESATNTVEVFGIGTDGVLNHAYSTNGSAWSGWNSIGSYHLTGSPSAVFNADNGTAEVFAIGTDGVMDHAYSINAAPWSGWSSLDPSLTFTGSPDTLYNASAKSVELFGIGAGGVMNHKTYNGSWSAWNSIGAQQVAGTPSTILEPNGNAAEVFAVGTNGVVNHSYSINGGSWSSWYTIGSTTFRNY